MGTTIHISGMTSRIEAFRSIPWRIGVMRITQGRRLLLCFAVMATYMMVSRAIYNTEGLSFAEIELIRTPIRLGGALLLWLLMADVMFGRRPECRTLRKPVALIALGLTLSEPLLTYDYVVTVPDALILAATTFPAAVFEEFFYRGILQTMLMKYVGAFHGILLTTICFVLFHVGATSPDVFNFTSIFLGGAMLGLIYFKTASLAAVILFHAASNVLICLPISPVLPQGAGIVLLSCALALFSIWAAHGRSVEN